MYFVCGKELVVTFFLGLDAGLERIVDSLFFFLEVHASAHLQVSTDTRFSSHGTVSFGILHKMRNMQYINFHFQLESKLPSMNSEDLLYNVILFVLSGWGEDAEK